MARRKIRPNNAVFDRLKQAGEARGLNAIQASELIRYTINFMTPIVRGMLLRNLRASGLKRRTGELERIVGSARLSIRGQYLSVYIPAGFTKKQYAKVNALNYGSVYSKQNIGDKAKRTIKTGTEKQLEKSRKAVSQRHTDRIIFRPEIDLGAARVRPGKHFFQFSPSQAREIQTYVNGYFNKQLERMINSRSA